MTHKQRLADLRAQTSLSRNDQLTLIHCLSAVPSPRRQAPLFSTQSQTSSPVEISSPKNATYTKSSKQHMCPEISVYSRGSADVAAARLHPRLALFHLHTSSKVSPKATSMESLLKFNTNWPRQHLSIMPGLLAGLNLRPTAVSNRRQSKLLEILSWPTCCRLIRSILAANPLAAYQCLPRHSLPGQNPYSQLTTPAVQVC